MRAKGLILPGYACTSQIWRSIRMELDALYDITWVDWPLEFIDDFHTVEAFAHWLHSSIQSIKYDFVIGHSMGGLVALDLAKKDKDLFRQVVLVETFLTPPTPFFQNLFLETGQKSDKRLILDMLAQEKAHYSPRLREALQRVDTDLAAINVGTKVQAIYGDRGCEEPNRVEKELGWYPELQQRVAISVVPNAAHFPMIENAEAMLHLLRAILE